jgi:copper chaperone CopZ
MNRIFKLSGLTCPACKKIIEKKLYSIHGVIGAIVDLKAQTVSIDSNREIKILEIKELLADTQYEVIK